VWLCAPTQAILEKGELIGTPLLFIEVYRLHKILQLWPGRQFFDLVTDLPD